MLRGVSTGVSPNAFTALEFAPVKTIAMRVEVTMEADATVGLAEWRVGAEPTLVPADDLSVRETFTLDGEVLDWTISLANSGTRLVEIGDLAVPLPFAERTGARGDIYTSKLLRHALVAGHGSWVYWQRSGGDGPYLRDDAGRHTKVRVLRQLGRRVHAVHPRERRQRAGDCRRRQLAAAGRRASSSRRRGQRARA